MNEISEEEVEQSVANAEVSESGKKSSAKSKLIKTEWKTMQPGDARAALSRGVHYSSRPVNSNASAVGVRLSADDRPNLSYVAFATLEIDRHITTYAEGANTVAIYNQAASVIEGKVDDKYLHHSPSQCSLIMNELDVLDERFVFGEQAVDPRLRQIFISLPGEDAVALTPLHSPPFSLELVKRLTQEKLDHPESIRDRVTLNIGGSNKQNVGRNISAMTRPLVFSGPRESFELRKAMSIHHKGVSIEQLLPRKEILAFIAYREAIRLSPEGFKSTLETREKEVGHLAGIVRKMLSHAAEISQTLDMQIEVLLTRTSSGLAPEIRGILEPSLRGKSWMKWFVESSVRAIESYRATKNSASIASDHGLQSLCKSIAAQLKAN